MKNKTALFSGLSLFLCVCFLTAGGKLSQHFDEPVSILLALSTEIIAFIVPLLFLRMTLRGEEQLTMRMTRKLSTLSVLQFTVCASAVASIAGFLVNFALYRTGLIGQWKVTSNIYTIKSDGDLIWILIPLALIVLPAILEEIFMRGAIFSAHETMVHTGIGILLSGLCFAMLHGSLENFAAPFIAGCLYAYLTYAFDCVWVAVLAHLLNNLYFYFTVWITDTYSAFGIWQFFAHINLIGLFLFAYLAFILWEKLLQTDQIRRFTKRDGTLGSLFRIVSSPGFIAFVLIFIGKAVFKLI